MKTEFLKRTNCFIDDYIQIKKRQFRRFFICISLKFTLPCSWIIYVGSN